VAVHVLLDIAVPAVFIFMGAGAPMFRASAR
jgi:hypothetical protein